MLVAAALVPDTVLLVPGASGRTDVHADLRTHALAAVRAVLACDLGRVVVVAPGRGLDDGGPVRVTPGPVRASLAAAGIPDGALRWRDAVRTPESGGPVDAGAPDTDGAAAGARDSDGAAAGARNSEPLDASAPDHAAPAPPAVGVSASVAVLLLREAGWTGPVDVVETAPAARGDGASASRLAGTGRALAPDGSLRTGLVVVGSLSARHGPDAPRADDERAPAYDAAVLADLADAGPAALGRLAALDPSLAGELDVTGWAPWQVLLGALPPVGTDDAPAERLVTATVHAAGAPLGAQHVVAAWVVAPDGLAGAGSPAGTTRPSRPEDPHA
ncbi:hypothetical protein AB6N24_21465 [Cellulomonas sp. 179-A 4D5 NHS]|uniref:hypothetical protein n=1 Tax=Cellulomonas sp. 179-A 4D5 NHS TaxID=3142378 RepID=UPI00399FEC53